MEAIVPVHYSSVPHTPSSHTRDSRIHPTRPIPIPDMHLVTHEHAVSDSSQNSLDSAHSGTSSMIDRAQDGTQNGSQLTDYSDGYQPVSFSSQDKIVPVANISPQRYTNTRDRTPEDCNGLSRQHDISHALASPMSITSPVTVNGTKRTASGHVKTASTVSNTSSHISHIRSRSRGASISSTGSRASELAATLKARLAYAAAKVHHGWEHKCLDEVEQLAMQKHTASSIDQRPGTSGLSNGTASMSMYDSHPYPASARTTSPPAKRHSASYSSLLQPPFTSVRPSDSAPRLQPPANIISGTQSRVTPSLSHKPTFSNAMSPPRTPHARPTARPGMLWGEITTTEAERDALQALSQLGSPHTSTFPRQQSLSQGSSSQTSPLRSEFATPRRVTFARSESSESIRHASSDSCASEDLKNRA